MKDVPPTTVAQLIAALQAFPPETRVVVDGYESGYDDPLAPKLMMLEAEDWGEYCGDYDEGRGFPAVVISRPGR